MQSAQSFIISILRQNDAFMRFSLFLLSILCILGSCGSPADGPLTDEEMEAIETKLLESIASGKLSLYSDQTMEFPLSIEEFNLFMPADSAGNRYIADFTQISEEELALNRGIFTENSQELAGVVIYSRYANVMMPVALFKWEDAKKVLKKDEMRRFKEYLVGNFQTQIEGYKEFIAALRLEVISERLFSALKDGSIAAYENDNLANIKSPGELETWLAHKVEQTVPDPDFPDDTIMEIVETPIGEQDITHYLAAYDEDHNIVAVTMMINEEIQGYPLQLPWVAMDFEEVSTLLEPEMLEFLVGHIRAHEVMQEMSESELDSLNA